MSDELEIERDDDSDLVRDLRKQLRAEKKSRTDAEAAVSAATQRLNERQLADVLAAKKLSPKLARFITSDGVDPSDNEAVDNWVKENAEIFGLSVEAAAPDQTAVDPAAQRAFELMQQAQFQQPVQTSAVQQLTTQAEELIAKGGTPEDLMKLYAGSGL